MATWGGAPKKFFFDGNALSGSIHSTYQLPSLQTDQNPTLGQPNVQCMDMTYHFTFLHLQRPIIIAYLERCNYLVLGIYCTIVHCVLFYSSLHKYESSQCPPSCHRLFWCVGVLLLLHPCIYINIHIFRRGCPLAPSPFWEQLLTLPHQEYFMGAIY